MAKITNVEQSTDKNGTPMRIVTFDGGQKVWVSSKYDSQNYESVIEGSEHPLHKEGNFWKIGAAGATSTTSGGFQSKKAGEIRVAQDHKEESIAYFNSVNSALALTVAYKDQLKNTSEMKMFIQEWRDFFLKEYKAHKDPTNEPPFS